MPTYIILSRIGPHAFEDPKGFKRIAQDVSEHIRRDCPNVRWQKSYLVTGRFDAVDIVEAPDLASVERAALIIRGRGHATTETLVATPWEDFIASLS
jgi:uncharacterized protein with GYD domain